MDSPTGPEAREVRDYYGRRYSVGAPDHELLGHPRRRQAWWAWACMAAISLLQYGFGVAALGLQADRGWSQQETMWLLALFVAFQAMVAIPVAWLYQRRPVSPAPLTVAGGALAACGVLTLAHVHGYAAAVGGFAIVGGVGAGLVYSACITTASNWFPDSRVATRSFVTGGFAIGAVPGIALLTIVTSPGAQTIVLDLAALAIVVVVTAAGLQLKDPPPRWWPPEIDAQLWAVDHQLNPSLPNNIPAARAYAPGEAMRTSALPLMWLILALISAVSLFGIAFIPSYAVATDLGLVVAGLAAGLLATVNGLGRSVAGRLSDRFGRRSVLAVVLAVEGFTQFGLALAGQAGSQWAFVLCAMLAGVGGGAFYTMLGNLVLEYFGENSQVENHAILYSAKAVGALVGVGGAVFLIDAVGYERLFVVAGLVGLGTAVIVRFLKQPGRPTIRAGGTGVTT